MSRIAPEFNSFQLGMFVHSDVDDAGLTVYEFRLWGRLCRRAGDNGRVFEGVKKMAAGCGMSEKQARRALHTLEERGWLSLVPRFREDGSQTTNDIILNTPRRTIRPAPLDSQTTPPGLGDRAEVNPSEVNPSEGKTPLTPQGVELPEWLSEEVWGDWLQHRREIKKPMTATASQKLLAKLGRLRDQGHDPASLIDEAISNGWQSVYEPKGVGKVPGAARRPANQAEANQRFVERMQDTSAAIKGVFDD